MTSPRDDAGIHHARLLRAAWAACMPGAEPALRDVALEIEGDHIATVNAGQRFDATALPELDCTKVPEARRLLVPARANADAIAAVIARGQVRVRDGRVTGVDEPALCEELASRTRSAIAADVHWLAWRDTLGQFAEDLGPFYRGRHFLGCC